MTSPPDDETIKACIEAYEKLNFDGDGSLWVFTAHGWFNLDDEADHAEFKRLHPGYSGRHRPHEHNESLVSPRVLQD